MDKKIIQVKYLPTDKIFELEIDSSMKIYEVKKKIEEILNTKINNKLMISRIGRRNMTNLSDENLSVFDSHIHNNDQIVIAKENVVGGGSPDEFANLSE